jgi:hypothetical protein
VRDLNNFTFKSAALLILMVAITLFALNPDHTIAQNPTLIQAIAWSSDGIRVGIGYQDGVVEIFNTITGMTEQTLQAHPADTEVNRLAWNPDDDLLASGNDEENVTVWDTATGFQEANLMDSKGGITLLTWNNDGSVLIAISGNIARWDSINDFQLINIDPNAGSIYELAWSTDRTHLATGSPGGITLHDPASFDTLNWFEEQHPRAVAISNDNSMIVTGNVFGRVALWDAASLQLIAIFQPAVEDALSLTDYSEILIQAVTFSTDGQYISAVQGNGTMMTWDVATTQLIEARELSIEPIYVASFSPDRTQLAYEGAGGTLQVVPTLDSTPTCDLPSPSPTATQPHSSMPSPLPTVHPNPTRSAWRRAAPTPSQRHTGVPLLCPKSPATSPSKATMAPSPAMSLPPISASSRLRARAR